MKKSRKIFVLATVVCVIAGWLFLSGLFPVNQGLKVVDARSKGPDVIRLPSPSNLTGVYVYYVAEELGYVRAENLKFQYVGVIATSQLLAAVVAGQIDVGGAHVNRTIAGINAGAKVKVVIAGTETTREIPHMTFVTLENSPIKSFKDIAGKRLGIYTFGGCNEYTTYAYLLQQGITNPKGTFEIVIIPAAKLEQALRQGDIDIAGLHDNPNNILARGGLKILFTDYDVWGTVGGNTPSYFSIKFIKEKPDVVRRFVKVIAKTQDWINANPEKAVEITAKWADVDPKLLRANYFAPHGIIKEDSVQVWIDLLERFGEIKPGIKSQNVYTNEFNEFYKQTKTKNK
jgi:ABC-type nitrate/sulfonate/bicarbonate transport system substrate-binding protein